jgi:hypothetical protein
MDERCGIWDSTAEEWSFQLDGGEMIDFIDHNVALQSCRNHQRNMPGHVFEVRRLDIATEKPAGLTSPAAMVIGPRPIADGEFAEVSPCMHSRWDFASWADGVECMDCHVLCSGESLAAMGFVRRGGYQDRANRLADECQVLRDENTKLRAELHRLNR